MDEERVDPTMQETPDMGDWLKIPSELELSLPPGTDLLQWLEENGMENSLLYRKLKAGTAHEEERRLYESPDATPGSDGDE